MKSLVAVSVLAVVSQYGSVGEPEQIVTADIIPEFRSFGEDDQRKLGIEKLDEAEQRAWLGALKSVMMTDLHRVAYDRMEAEGWEAVRVVGSRKIKMDEFDEWGTDCLIVQVGITTWAIEEPLLSYFAPGSYWAKTSGFSGVTEMLDSNGSEQSFLFSKSKSL